ncbi:MAG TPA: CPBP family intramembrane glutamic endopeptidase [Thermomicrobiales bacterium]|nr:CPBP family intramembrane glutamic endopeptidase [Thermomicrobiales bacterium]
MRIPANGQWRLWAVLTEGSVAATAAVLSYLYGLLGPRFAADNERRVAAGKRPLTPVKLAAATLAQAQVQFGVVAALGLRAARAQGLGAPRLAAWLRGEPAGLAPGRAAAYAATGVAAGLAAAALHLTVFRSLLARLTAAGVREPGVWQGLLATFYGAIAEEVLLRLGAQTVIAAGLRRLRGETSRPPTGATMWPAIALSNVLFGLGHLPVTRELLPLTPAVVARALALNAVAGVPCGYLYWREGLEAAMLAHGAADLVLHVGGALVQDRLAAAPGETA